MNELDSLWEEPDKSPPKSYFQSESDMISRLNDINKTRKLKPQIDYSPPKRRKLTQGKLYDSTKGIVEIISYSSKVNKGRTAVVKVVKTGEILDKFNVDGIFREVK